MQILQALYSEGIVQVSWLDSLHYYDRSLYLEAEREFVLFVVINL